MPSPSQQAFKDAMAHVIASVFLITTDGPAGKTGFTATSVTSVSNTPPSLLVCANKSGHSLSIIENNGCFALSLLSAQSRHLANRFAGRDGIDGHARFDGAVWQTGATGSPMLASAATAFDCELAQAIPHGSHMILVGNALELWARDDGEALLYGQRTFGRFQCEAS